MFPEVTRVTVVGQQGTEFERYNLYTDGAEIHLQDGGHTLKVFPRIEVPEAKSSPEMEAAEALHLGWLVGALMANPHMQVSPVMDGEDYTNQVLVRMQGPTGPVAYRLTITEEEA